MLDINPTLGYTLYMDTIDKTKKESEMRATYHLIGTDKPTGVRICVKGNRDGYTKREAYYMAERDFDLIAGKAELIALKDAGYTIDRGSDITE